MCAAAGSNPKPYARGSNAARSEPSSVHKLKPEMYSAEEANYSLLVSHTYMRSRAIAVVRSSAVVAEPKITSKPPSS